MTDLTSHPPVEIPATLARRPLWKGRYPIPYVMYVDSNGVPDFRVNDEGKRLETIERGLCALCGVTLNPRWAALVGGPACERSHLFMDGPMHVGCARYAFTICPYLAAPNAHHAETDTISSRHPEVEIRVDERAGAERPDRMGLFFARAWRIVRVNGQPDLYFQVAEFARVEWYA